MLGSKMGTGGSSGFHYLRTAAVYHKVFTDYFNLSTYMIPKRNLPPLPSSISSFMKFPSTPKAAPRRPSGPTARLTNELPPFSTLLATKSVSDLMLSIDRSKGTSGLNNGHRVLNQGMRCLKDRNMSSTERMVDSEKAMAAKMHDLEQ